MSLFATFPEAHFFHKLAAFTLQTFANQGRAFFVAVFFPIAFRSKAVFSQMLFRNNFECFAAFHASNAVFFDGFRRINGRFGCGDGFPFG